MFRLTSVTGLLVLANLATMAAAQGPKIDFDRHVRPILSDHCFKCHGPDAAERKAGLRFDDSESLLKPADSGDAAVVPGQPDKSSLVERIESTDPEQVMPPPAAKKPLSDDQKRILRQWVAEGAKFEKHWSFTAPKRPELPKVNTAGWARTAIDRFLLKRLEQENLTPSPEADRVTLIRRLTLDLTGLPPTLAEVDAFVANTRPDAYSQLVERLLASPRFGERMAVDWLDASRFADTNGYHIDNGRDMTRWREWVINAFNQNLPYDQFTVEQLAGDLLPNPTLSQKIASGFNRNHMINFEGGAIPEEYLNAYVVDRVNTTATVWLGLTVACTQCHDHKFDPLTQREFYQLYAFFNNLPEKGLDGYQGNAVPLIKAPSDEQQTELSRRQTRIQSLEQQLAAANPEWDAAQAAWEPTAIESSQVTWTVLDPDRRESEGGAKFETLDDKSLLVSGPNPVTDVYVLSAVVNLKGVTGLKIEALPHASFPNNGPGRSVNGNVVATNLDVTLAPAEGNAPPIKVKLPKATADFSQETFPVSNLIDADRNSGWAIHPQVGQPHAVIVSLAPAKVLSGPQRITVLLEFKSQFAQHQLGHFRLSVTDVADPNGNGLPDAVRSALAAKTRNDEQRQQIRQHFRAQVHPTSRGVAAELEQARKALADFEATIPTAMVMQETQVKDSFLLVRGQYDKKGEKVVADVPAVLPPLSAGAPRNRLSLARWLVDPAHPLTARVTVNRYWQMLFGTGLVKTAEDFGSQGELPSHPELLDWLAVEFQSPTEESGTAATTPWDVKRLIRLMVTSAAYRQTSHVSPTLKGKDPENRLLARGPRFRLQAEFIRDQALFVSGLLDSRIGGKSVSPYQPPGIWEELASRADGKNWTAQEYEQSHGPDLYRRTMYTFWKRTAPPPSLITFDAPDRETCTIRRARTNTPLQALILMNDPTYVEASRKLAERILRHGGSTVDERLTFAFRICLSRVPTPRERQVLRALLEKQQAAYVAKPAAAESLLKVGEAAAVKELSPVDVATWTTISSVLLNLDETVTKG